MNEDIEIPQATLSAPETREHAEQVLCRVCGKEVSLIDRQGSRSVHPFCARSEAGR